MAFEEQTTIQNPCVGSISAVTLGEIAIQRPGAIAVFLRHKLDYSCDGAVSLAEAVATRQIALDDLVKELRRLRDARRACATWRRLYDRAGKLVDDSIDHIHTESNILFTRFAQVRSHIPTNSMLP